MSDFRKTALAYAAGSAGISVMAVWCGSYSVRDAVVLFICGAIFVPLVVGLSNDDERD